MATVRRDYRDLTPAQQKALVDAIDRLHGTAAAAPAYRAFVQVHVQAMSMAGAAWEVHTMPGMVGTNFLCWHREYLRRFEERLQQADASVALPYWDWAADAELPPFLSQPADLARWSVTREWDPEEMPTKVDVDAAFERRSWRGFQRRLELGPHADVHVAIGGTMNSASSPADPVFWLHHANLDRLWTVWQSEHPRVRVPQRSTVLQPFGVRVADVLDPQELGYTYA